MKGIFLLKSYHNFILDSWGRVATDDLATTFLCLSDCCALAYGVFNELKLKESLKLFCRRSWQCRPSEGNEGPSAQSVNGLLCGTRFLMVKGTACLSFCIKSLQIFTIIKLTRRMFVFFVSLRDLGKFSILVVLLEKKKINNNIHLYSLFGCKFWICRLCSKKKVYSLERFHGKGFAAKSWQTKNQSEPTNLLKTGLTI